MDSTHLVSLVFIHCSITVSWSDLSGTLGGILGRELKAAGLGERGGGGGAGLVSAMSFKKTNKQQPKTTNISKTSGYANLARPV